MQFLNIGLATAIASFEQSLTSFPVTLTIQKNKIK